MGGNQLQGDGLIGKVLGWAGAGPRPRRSYWFRYDGLVRGVDLIVPVPRITREQTTNAPQSKVPST